MPKPIFTNDSLFKLAFFEILNIDSYRKRAIVPPTGMEHLC